MHPLLSSPRRAVIKIRMQLSNELAIAAAAASSTAGGTTTVATAAALHMQRPPGLVATLAGLVRDEGPAGIMRGVTPSMLREATYSTIRYGAYEPGE